MTSINATTLGDADTTADTGETIELRPISGLLGYKIEVGRFTEDVMRELIIECRCLVSKN